MTSDKKGIWHNFETGESGNLLNLLQKETGLSFKDALKYVATTLSSSGLLIKKEPQVKSEFSNKIDTKIGEYAQKLAQESLSIKGTVVEKYLKDVRGIKDMDSVDIRYHPNVFTSKEEAQKYLPAMLAVGRDKDGNIKCVQATYLDPKTAQKAELAVNKRTYSSPAGNSVYLQKSSEKEKISCITEGVETGLSVKDAAKDSEVIAVLGKSNFAHIETKKSWTKSSVLSRQ